MSGPKYRLVTRSDFDGLVCAVLLRSLDLIDDITFVHPKDVQDGVVEVTDRDILTNLPYAPAAHIVFDHHHSETLRNAGERANHVIDAAAPSAAGSSPRAKAVQRCCSRRDTARPRRRPPRRNVGSFGPPASRLPQR